MSHYLFRYRATINLKKGLILQYSRVDLSLVAALTENFLQHFHCGVGVELCECFMLRNQKLNDDNNILCVKGRTI